MSWTCLLAATIGACSSSKGGGATPSSTDRGTGDDAGEATDGAPVTTDATSVDGAVNAGDAGSKYIEECEVVEPASYNAMMSNTPTQVTVSGNTITLTGVTIGPFDGWSCPDQTLVGRFIPTSDPAIPTTEFAGAIAVGPDGSADGVTNTPCTNPTGKDIGPIVVEIDDGTYSSGTLGITFIASSGTATDPLAAPDGGTFYEAMCTIILKTN